MSVLHVYFDYECNQASPVRDDLVRVVNFDEDNVEHVTYEKFDYPTYQKSLGDSSVWDLKALLSAGINPAFGIHTSFGTRLDGINTIKQAEAYVEKLVADNEIKSE